MSKIIVVFPKKDTATNIRNILVRNGLAVTGIGTTGAQAIQSAETLDEGIVICGYKMLDMMYTELREYLPDTFEMLVIASPDKWGDGIVNGVVGLTMPLKVHDLLSSTKSTIPAFIAYFVASWALFTFSFLKIFFRWLKQGIAHEHRP